MILEEWRNIIINGVNQISLEDFVRYGIWAIFLFLASYTTISWVKKDWIKDIDDVRKVWYLIFIFGCLVFVTADPTSLLTDWKNYLIALVAFVVIDSLVFLNLYFAKFGGHKDENTRTASR